jgi:hypothetical protein
MRRLVTVGFAGLLLALGTQPVWAASFAQPFLAEQWSVQAGVPGGPQVSFSDDFEDNFFSSASYQVLCGGTPGETGGALVLNDPSAGGPCPFPSQSVAASLTFLSEATVQGQYRWVSPVGSEGYGLLVSNLDGSDFVSLFVINSAVGEPLVFAADENTSFGGSDFLDTVLAAGALGRTVCFIYFSYACLPTPTSSIEFEVVFTDQAGQLIPEFRVGVDNGALMPLTRFANPGAIGEAGDALGASLFAGVLVPEPSLALLLTSGLLGLAWTRRRGLH